MNAFEEEKLKREIREEVEKEYQEKIKKGEIKIVNEKDKQSEFKSRVRELAAKTRLIK